MVLLASYLDSAARAIVSQLRVIVDGEEKLSTVASHNSSGSSNSDMLWIPDASAEWLQTHLRVAFELATGTLLLTIFLEFMSLGTVQGLLTTSRSGKSLYAKAWWTNVRNHFLLGPPVYVSASLFFIHESKEPFSVAHCILVAVRTLTIVLIHAICYYHVHKLMHLPEWYQYHAFHHRFKTHVPPVAANAVSVVEYMAAYVLPFAVAALWVRPTGWEMKTAVSIVSLTNLVIHTPPSDAVSQFYKDYLEPYMVSPANHTQHHRELKVHYAAPTINVDWLVQLYNEWSKEAEEHEK